MRKICLVVLILSMALLAVSPVYAQEKRTRQYTPVIKQATYSDNAPQTNAKIWDQPLDFDSIVLDSYTISSNSNAIVTLSASDTIVKLHITASRPVVSPGNFLWKGVANEIINVTTILPGSVNVGEITVTLTGWEESN